MSRTVSRFSRMRAQLIRLATFALLAASTAAAAARLHVWREKPYDLELIPTPAVLGVAFLGHRLLAANLNWLRAVQYIGEPRANERGWDRLHPMVEVVTDLDPGHGYAYQVAGVILSAVGRIDESNAILEKGIRNRPDRYVLPYYRAFNAFYYSGDFATAGRYVEIAARVPGAPPHVNQNVLAYYVKGKRADLAIAFLEEALRQAADDESRRALRGQLEQARLEAAAEAIDEAAARFRDRNGFVPVTVVQLVHEGDLAELPSDPHGGDWIFGEDRRAISTAHPYRVPAAPRPEQMGAEPGVHPGTYGAHLR